MSGQTLVPKLRFPGISSEVWKLARGLTSVINKTTIEDGDILERGRSERLFASKFAANLQSCINSNSDIWPAIKADANYNKHGRETKRANKNDVLSVIEIDIAVHKRGTDEKNLLVIELETSNTPERDDMWKLEELTRQDGDYDYALGLYLVLGVNERAGQIVDRRWYIDGAEVKS